MKPRTNKPSLEPARGENPALSYRNLRAIVGYVGLTLPAVLFITGLVDGHIESSISAYYYTKVGIVFTGALCVIGVFLLAYRLRSVAIENIATTLAGAAALGVAFFHAAPKNATHNQLLLSDVHLVCAATLFFLLGAISLFIFPRDVPKKQKWQKRGYRAFGIAIWLSLILMPALNLLAGSFYDNHHVFFALEAVCVIAFAISFILKGQWQLANPEFSQYAEQQRPLAAAGAAAEQVTV